MNIYFGALLLYGALLLFGGILYAAVTVSPWLALMLPAAGMPLLLGLEIMGIIRP